MVSEGGREAGREGWRGREEGGRNIKEGVKKSGDRGLLLSGSHTFFIWSCMPTTEWVKKHYCHHSNRQGSIK